MVTGISLQAQDFRTGAVSVGLYAGFGLPKVSYSVYRPPISVTAGMALQSRVRGRIALRLTGNGLYTFGLGTITDDNYKIRFNTAWADAGLLYRLTGRIFTENYLTFAMGRYTLDQRLEGETNKVTTLGINLGILQLRHHGKWRSTLDVRWHLLFRPSPNPQMLTITFGWII